MVNYEGKCFLKEDILTKITYNLNFSFQLGFSVADFTSVARMNLAGIALRANTIIDHCDDGCDVYDRDGQVNPITVNMVVWKFAITDNSLLCLCVLFLMRLYVFIYLDVSSYNMRRRIIDRQTIQKSS